MRAQESEVVGHIVSTLRKQREDSAGTMQTDSFGVHALWVLGQ